MPCAPARLLIPPDISTARFGAFRPDLQLVRYGGQTMGTSWSIAVALPVDANAEAVHASVVDRLETVVRLMSPWEPSSDLRRFFAAPAGDWVSLSEECFFVLSRSLHIAALSEGRYDPTFAEAIDLLGFGPTAGAACHPEAPSVQAALRRAGYRALVLDAQRRAVKQPGGLGIDLCSIAKGFAVDWIVQTLNEQGLHNHLVEIGGEARGSGCKPSGEPWVVSLERPAGSEAKLSKLNAALCGLSVATSGNYLRYRMLDGQPIGHLVNPYPQGSDATLLSVSALSGSCTDADGFASALFLLGLEEGMRLAEEQSLAAYFIYRTEEGVAERWSRPLQRLLD